MIDDHVRRDRICGEPVQLCAEPGGMARWSPAVDPALGVTSGRLGAGRAVARWSQRCKSRDSRVGISLCSVPGGNANRE